MSKTQLSVTQTDKQSDHVSDSQDVANASEIKSERIIQEKPVRKWYSYIWDTFGESRCLIPRLRRYSPFTGCRNPST